MNRALINLWVWPVAVAALVVFCGVAVVSAGLILGGRVVRNEGIISA